MYIFLFVSVEREDQRRPVMGFEFGHTVRLRRRPKAAKEYTSNGTSVGLSTFTICTAFDVSLTLVYIPHGLATRNPQQRVMLK